MKNLEACQIDLGIYNSLPNGRDIPVPVRSLRPDTDYEFYFASGERHEIFTMAGGGYAIPVSPYVPDTAYRLLAQVDDIGKKRLWQPRHWPVCVTLKHPLSGDCEGLQLPFNREGYLRPSALVLGLVATGGFFAEKLPDLADAPSAPTANAALTDTP